MLMSVGVIIAATIIYFFPDYWYADPLCTYLFSIIVLFTTTPIIKMCIRVLMEGAPLDFDVDALRQALYDCNSEDIHDIHDLHVWAIAPGKLSMTCHIVSVKPLKSLARATDVCRRKFDLHHTSIQVEGINDNKKNPHAFKCENDIHA